MTRAEARQIITDWLAVSEGEKGQCGYIEGWFYEKDVEAFQMAIEALEQDPTKQIKKRRNQNENKIRIHKNKNGNLFKRLF